MKESLRRVILFTVIVVTGSVMILFDVPLIFMIPLILAVGFVILLLLGAITVADIRSALKTLNLQNLKKIKILKRLDEMKFFEKKAVQPDKKPVSPSLKTVTPPGDTKKTGIGSHLHSFFTSLRSLGTVLKERSKRERKVEHINELLDKAVSEKVKGSALASAAGNDTKIKPSPSSVPAFPARMNKIKTRILSCPCPGMNLTSVFWTDWMTRNPPQDRVCGSGFLSFTISWWACDCDHRAGNPPAIA